jgi:hypothetical protein
MKNKLNSLILITIFSLLFLACDKSNQTSQEQPPKVVPTPTPEELRSMNSVERMNAIKEIQKILADNVLRCDDQNQEHWLALYEYKGKTNLFSFTHFTEYERQKVEEDLWKFVPEGIEQRFYDNGIIRHRGHIEFILFNDKDDNKKNSLYSYNQEKQQWNEIQNFDAGTLNSYNLPLKIHLRKYFKDGMKTENDQTGVWEFENSPNVWEARFPFKKPNVPCEILKNKKQTLRPYTIALFGKPDPSPNPSSTPADKPADRSSFGTNEKSSCEVNSSGYLTITTNLRSSPSANNNENKIDTWLKDTKVKIVSIVEGTARKDTGSNKWYKVQITESQCDRGDTCKRAGYFNSDSVACNNVKPPTNY